MPKLWRNFAALCCISSVSIALPTTGYVDNPDAASGAFTASDLLNRTIQAVGGKHALSLIEGLTLQSSSIYRSQTLTQNYNLYHSDQSVAEAGSQNLSFSFTGGMLTERIDRTYKYNDYWIWAQPDLQPDIDYSLVVHTGANASASFIKGQNVFYSSDPSQAGGFVDPYLNIYLVQQAQQYALLGLLKQFALHPTQLSTSTSIDSITNTTYHTIQGPSNDLVMLLNPLTSLPHAVRSQETQKVFGLSTSDLIFLNFTSIPITNADNHNNQSNVEILLPHRYLTVYNSEVLLEDFIVDSYLINPAFPQSFFTPASSFPPAFSVVDSNEYPLSEVHELFETGLWEGPVGEQFNISDIVVAPLFPNATQPGAARVYTVYIGYADYVQLIVEFDDGLLITDAPDHRSRIILEYLNSTQSAFSGKQVKYIIPSHHHRDHAGGIGDYLAAGATLVIPEVARRFYQSVKGASQGVDVVTYSQAAPFKVSDDKVQVTSLWMDEAPHARDWTYVVVEPACSLFNSSAGSDKEAQEDVAIFAADVVSPGPTSEPALRWDVGYARQWLTQMIHDGVPRGARVVGSHGGGAEGSGTEDSISHIAELAGFDYPDVVREGRWC